ncbi:hypothetical protein [Niveibacterium terrae]|uniref:hypothetical protein n=1 Tax=Niveibacterium terrae TaxID=3373598 RepID=UPI003A94D6C4
MTIAMQSWKVSLVPLSKRDKKEAFNQCDAAVAQCSRALSNSGVGWSLLPQNATDAHFYKQKLQKVFRWAIGKMAKPHPAFIFSLSIVHALGVFIVWLVDLKKDIALIPTPIWVVMAWAWLAWPIIFVVTKKYWAAAASCLVGAVLIFPTATTVWFATSVYLFGFAP